MRKMVLIPFDQYTRQGNKNTVQEEENEEKKEAENKITGLGENLMKNEIQDKKKELDLNWSNSSLKNESDITNSFCLFVISFIYTETGEGETLFSCRSCPLSRGTCHRP